MWLLLILFISSNCFCSELLIEGERIEYKDGLVSASSKTTISFEDIKMTSEGIEIKQDIISCTSSSLLTERFQFFGKRIKKEKQRIIIEDGWFSTCFDKKPHYRLTSKNITIGPKIVKASNIVLRIGDFPVFYIPFYSHLLESKDSPYSIQAGRSSYLGFFVKTRYNHSFEQKRLGFLLDYYQKKGPGFGIDILSNNSRFFGYFNEKDKWLFNGSYQREPIKIIIEKLSDRAFLYDYFKKDIWVLSLPYLLFQVLPEHKDETRSYIMLEKTRPQGEGRLVFEERDDFSKEVHYIPKAQIFLSQREFKGWVASLNIEGENALEEKRQNFTINPRILKKIDRMPILQTIDIKAKEKGDLQASSISNVRLLDKNIRLDIGYSIYYSLKEKKKWDKIPFLLEGSLLSLEGEFLLKEKRFEDTVFLFSIPHLKIQGRYKNKKLDASLDMRFEKEKYGLGLLWVIKGDENDTMAPYLLLKKRDLSFKISGYYGGEEDYLEAFITKAFHCINLDFMINTKMDVGINLSLR